MSDLLGWVLSILFVLFWALPVALLIWVAWEVIQRLRRGAETKG